MITGELFIAKAVTAIAGKTASKLLALPLDKRKQACRALTKLYYAIVSLDEVTDDFLAFAKACSNVSEASALVAAVRSHAHRFEVPSNAFIDLSCELEAGLQIIDPALATSLSFLYHGKADFLSFLSTTVDVQDVAGSTKIVMYKPNEKILGADFERAYQGSLAASNRGETYYWPADAFNYFSDFEEFDVSAATDDAAKDLLAMIRAHQEQLKLAREALRRLLVASFSIEELLFQPKSAGRR